MSKAKTVSAKRIWDDVVGLRERADDLMRLCSRNQDALLSAFLSLEQRLDKIEARLDGLETLPAAGRWVWSGRTARRIADEGEIGVG